jgi:hypothetical protein
MNPEEVLWTAAIVGFEPLYGAIMLAFMTNTGIFIELYIATEPARRQQLWR